MHPMFAVLAVLAVTDGPAAGSPADAATVGDGRFLAVFSESIGDVRLNFSWMFESEAQAQVAAEKIALCGFWRIDLQTVRESLIPASAVREILIVDPDEIPPPPLQWLAGDPLPLPPLPDVARIVECPAGRRRPTP